MSILKKINTLSAESKRLFGVRAIAWGLPVALIPTTRFVQDKDKNPSLRKELFIRDFSSYSVGAGIYFASLVATANLFNSPKVKKIPTGKKILASEVIATGAYCLWSGVLAPKLSKKFNKNSGDVFGDAKKPLESQQPTRQVVQRDSGFTPELRANRPAPFNVGLYSKFKI